MAATLSLRDGRHVALPAVAGLLALGLGAALVALAPDAARVPAGGRAVPFLIVAVGWAFVGVGSAVWLRRPDNGIGALLAGFGLAVLFSGLWVADAALPYLLAKAADPLAIALFIHLLLAFPSGRLEERSSRRLVAAGYSTAIVPQVATLLFDARLGDADCATCPRNLLLVAHQEAVAEAATAVQRAAGVVLVVLTVVVLVRRRRAADAFQRRAFAPVLGAGALVLVLGILSAAAQDGGAGAGTEKLAQLVFIAAFALLPCAFLAGLVRSRFFRTATVARLLGRLAAERREDGVDGDFAAALGDPSLTVGHWLPERGRYVDRHGRPFALPPPGGGRVATEVSHHGRRLGVLVHDAGLAEDEQLIGAAASAAALALENDRLEVELRARLEALRTSRARLVEAGDAERRRLGRDLHDGAQQRLVSLLIELRLATERWDADPARARELVGQALESAETAVEELRDLAAGIHPAVLSQRGLDAALESLAARAALPVEVDVVLDERLPEAVETAAYFVAAEALTNVAKHAQATFARVVVRRDAGGATLTVADDGAGGAALDGGGSGLRGLEDRVGALDGTLSLRSPPGHGTLLRAHIPLRPIGDDAPVSRA